MDPQDGFIDRQFLLGKGLMVSPVIEPGVTTVDVYFPLDRWFDFISGEVVHGQYAEGDIFKDYPAALNATIPLFIRGGYIVPVQSTEGVRRSDDLDNNYTLVVGLKEFSVGQYSAMGKLLATSDFLEDGINQKCIQGNCLLDVTVNAYATDLESIVLVNFIAEDTEASLDEIGITQLSIFGCFSDGSRELQVDAFHQKVYFNGELIQSTVQEARPNGEIIVSLTESISVKAGDNIKVISTVF